MDEELPSFDRIELEMAERAARLAIPTIKTGTEDPIRAVWGYYPEAARQMIAEGVDSEAAARALERARLRMDEPEGGTVLKLPPDVDREVNETYAAALANEPEFEANRLDEKWVKEITEFKMYIYLDESKHRGFPHVRVDLPDGKINISISETPTVVAGKRNLRGEAAALKAVKKHHAKLQKFWNDTRPDDQKLPPRA